MRRTLKWLLALFALPALLVLAVAAAAWWLVGTQSGLAWALGEAAERSEGRLEVGRVQGTLLGGFSIEELRVKTDAAIVQARELSARLDLIALSTATLAVKGLEEEGLQASHVAVELLATEPKGGTTAPPARLGVPLPVEIPKARIAGVSVRRGADAYALTELRFSYSGNATEHRLHDVTAQTPWGNVALEATMGAAAPFRVEARGSLERPEGRANAYVRVQPFAAQKLEALQLDAENLDLSRFQASLPSTSLTVQLSGEATREALFAGTLRAANGTPGPLDRNRVPVVALDAALALQDETLQIRALDALAAGGRVSGSGRLERTGALLRLDLRGIDLRAVRSSLRNTALAGTVQVEATPERQTIRGTVAQADMTLTAHAVREGDHVEVRAFEAAAAGGKATGSGRLRLGDPLGFDAKLEVHGFDPARFGDYPQGVLNGQATVSGALGDALRLEARWRLHESELAGRPLAAEGHGTLAGERVLALDAQATWGRSHATARGALGAPGDRLAWTLEAPDLPRTFLDGRVEASGTAEGSWRTPRVAFEARVAPATLAGRVALDALSASGEGTLEAHEVRIAARGEGFDVAASLRGGWGGDAWRGELTRLTNAGRYRLELQAPVPLTLSPEHAGTGELRARLGNGLLFVRAFEWRPGFLATRGEVAGLPARWAIVAAGLGRQLRSTLLLDGAWDIASIPALQGRVELRRASGDLQVLEPLPLELGLQAATLAARFDDGAVSATLELDGAIGKASASARAASLEADAALSLQAEVALADIRPLTGPLPPELRVAGRAAASLEARGTVGAPEIAARLSADELSVQMPPYGIHLDRGELRAALEGKALRVERFVLHGGSGRFTASGTLPFGKDAPPAALDWEASRLRLLSRPDLRLIVSGSGQARLAERRGAAKDLRKRVALEGALTIDRGRIERGLETLPTLDEDIVVESGPLAEQTIPARDAPPPVALDLRVNLGKDFRVRHSGFDGRLRGEVRLVTAEGELRAFGRIEAASESTFRAYGRTLEVDPGAVIFDGALDNPSLQITAWRRNQEVAAGVRVTGTLVQPRVELVSDPPLPEGAKLSWLVLGHAPTEASGADIGLLQTAAAALLDRGTGVPLTTRLADAVGVDELTLRGSAQLEERVVAVGKRISDRIYLSYEQGVGAVAQSLVKVDFALTERVSLRGQTGSTSGAGIYYRYAWD